MKKIKYLFGYQILRLRDEILSDEEIKSITEKTKERQGYVDFRGIFVTMGYKNAINDKWVKLKIE